MSQYIIDAVVRKGHIEIRNLPLPDETKVKIIVKSEKKNRKEKRVDRIMSMMPKRKMGGILGSLRREDIYDDDGR